MIRVFIVDDEEHNRVILKTLLKKYSSNIEVIGESDNVNDAYVKIYNLKPQLVFLDVKMPVRNGFDLLKLFKKINFEVVFVTAYDEFAINAFELNAIGYILKPIDYNLFVNTISKAVNIINSNMPQRLVADFIETLNIDNTVCNKITVHHKDKVVFLEFSNIVLIQIKNGICEIFTIDNIKYYSTKDLKMYENVFKSFKNLIRVSKSCIINVSFISSYSKGEPCVIFLSNGYSIEVPRRKKTEILNLLTNF